eukprot:TRINITY_DN5432_c0_g1_i1.p1 TRINITY_DN5432_c0_g1~~TRINITY_DN5432_c0_g1_i1.p1  ORF type:complete len:598 (+),score=183.73 TRINITY_DN5432_c0_g1_i1:1-1794(+)
MKTKLRQQSKSNGFGQANWQALNTLCWAIGSISGVLTEDEEKRFLVFVIKDLLEMCEKTSGKNNKAVIASNIMYIVGQYPNFLRAHWRFLRTVVNKLFEFMHEKFPGVQDMACDTFLKISKSCSTQFVINHNQDNGPYVIELLNNISSIIKELQPTQVHTFYKAVGYMVSAAPEGAQVELIELFMRLPNIKWNQIMANANQSVDNLNQIEVAKMIINILRTNVNAASSVGPGYMLQIDIIFMEILQVYRHYSKVISDTIDEKGEIVTRYANIRKMRGVKKETLRLLQTFITNAIDLDTIMDKFIDPMLEAVLVDYQTNIPQARDPEVLSLITAIINKLQNKMVDRIGDIFGCIFECTISMIQTNFQDFPDHRVNFFNLLRSINNHCFDALLCIPGENFKLIIDAIVWAFKHTMRNVADTGLYILAELWDNISHSDVADPFYQTYFISLLQDVFFVLTEGSYKSGFAMQSHILLNMFYSVRTGQVTVPLWDVDNENYNSNEIYLLNFLCNLIKDAFPNLTSNQVEQFTQGLFEKCNDLPGFKELLRDFLVEMKEWQGEDKNELYSEENLIQKQQNKEKLSQIPGMIKPSELEAQQNQS